MSASGECHCGAVKITIPERPEQVTSCNCSICRRLGMFIAYAPESQVEIEAGPEAFDHYIWGDKKIAFMRCAHCGCATHWRGLGADRADRMGINIRNFDPSLLEHARVRRFDGAETWQFLDE